MNRQSFEKFILVSNGTEASVTESLSDLGRLQRLDLESMLRVEARDRLPWFASVTSVMTQGAGLEAGTAAKTWFTVTSTLDTCHYSRNRNLKKVYSAECRML